MTARPFTAQLDIDNSVQPVRVSIKGDWVLAHYRVLEPVVAQFRANQPQTLVFDLSQLGAVDTAGATLLALLLGEERISKLRELAPQLPEERRTLLQTVSRVLPDLASEPAEKNRHFGLSYWRTLAVRSIIYGKILSHYWVLSA